jgi:hypothetical protein
MLKRMLVFIVLLTGMLLVARAQEATPVVFEDEREIYSVLHWGDGVFEPEIWYASAEELPTRTRATWLSDSLGGLAFADYLHFDEGIVFGQISAVFNQDWFEGTLGPSYTVWRENVRCDLGDVRLLDFSLQKDDVKYQMRYWIKTVTPYRVMTIHIVLPSENQEDMDRYAGLLFPDLPSCTGSVG